MNNLPPVKKSLGQHWLTDQPTLQKICEAGEVTGEDVILEIGPGPGALTRLLVKQAGRVVAVEYDADLADRLTNLQIAKNLQIINQDILSFDLTSLPPNYKVIANIPYYLTSKLLRVLSESSNPPKKVVLLIQKEVAERVASKPGAMSILSVSAQYYWEVSLGIIVPARLFTPPPKVDSQVIVLDRRSQPLFTGVDTHEFFRIVKSGFSSRRKTILNSLSGGLRLSKEETKELLDKSQLQPGFRAQALSLDDWYRLYQAVQRAEAGQ